MRTCQAMSMQWPVGQGGFWTTSGMYRGHKEARIFEICFDCGTATRGGLDIARRFHRPLKRQIDYLFVSHLDSDHTSGLEWLLKAWKVDTVVLPLLDTAAILLSCARLATQGQLSPPNAQMVLDPARYFGERGVRRLVQVRPAPEDPEEPKGEPRVPVDGDLAGGDQFLDPGLGTAPGPIETIVASSELQIRLAGSDRQPFWQLIPYVHPFEPARIGRFLECATELLDRFRGEGNRANALQALVRNRQARERLKTCYQRVRSDHNSVSLSLFSSPLPNYEGRGIGATGLHREWSGYFPHFWDARFRRLYNFEQSRLLDLPRLGWMHTGDSALARTEYWRRWVEHYAQFASQMGTLVVPHHGSERSFNEGLLQTFKPELVIACAGRGNKHRHPHSSVKRAAKRSTRGLRQVSQSPESAIFTYLEVWWKN